MSDMRRYLIRRTGSGKAEVARGLRWLEMKAALLLYGKGGLYVPDLDKLDAIAPVIGGAQGRALRSDKEIQMGAITVELLTDRSLPAAYQEPILAIWPDDGQLRAIEQLGPEHLCVVEWEERLITEWIADHHPEEDLANTTSSRPPADTSNAVVDVALGELTTGADRDRSKLHPVDRATAINTFRHCSPTARCTFRARSARGRPTTDGRVARRRSWRSSHETSSAAASLRPAAGESSLPTRSNAGGPNPQRRARTSSPKLVVAPAFDSSAASRRPCG
jgi:hypothetical protein